jgi:hypothetical protein
MVLVKQKPRKRSDTSSMKPSSNIIVYSKATNGIGARLQEAVETILPRANVEFFHSIYRLSERLHRPALSFPIIVLLAMNREDLENIIAIQDLLFDSRIVLILPDKEDDTLALGHSLRPRFVSYRDSSFKDVGAVLGKMVNRPETIKA